MSEHSVKVDISFRSLLEAVSLLDINYKKELWQLLEAELFPEEEYSLEDMADIQAARADYQVGDYVTFDRYRSQRANNSHSIVTDKTYPELTEIQRHELDHRISDYEMNPENLLGWEEVRASVTARF